MEENDTNIPKSSKNVTAEDLGVDEIVYDAINVDVIGFGALNVDKLYKVGHIAEIDGESFIKGEEESPGGSAANTIIGLSNIAKDYLEVKQPEKATMWYHRADSLLNVFKTYPDAKEEKIDKMQALLLQLKIKIAGANKDKEAAAKAFEEYQETAYSKTQDGRWKMISYLMKNKRFDEAADIYMQLDSRMSQKNGGLSLDNIRKHYVGKFKANVQAGRKDSAWVVAEKVMMALDSAVADYQQSEMAELTTMYQTQQKEAEIARQQVEISSQRFIGLVVVLLLITTFFVIYSMYRRKALHQIALAKAAKERMESELRIARDIQMSMVPHEFPKLEGLPVRWVATCMTISR